ncbi:MAG TPA: urate oxidase [Candidatus Sulfotelmatobacter sp.]|jgi:urate oxidase|nr:urate oxidase [Candidatus Sulfotelmatobacter sp.]
MAIRLGENNYGKQRVRILQVSRRPDRHDIKELTLGIRLEGDFESTHSKGDNRKILPTDTMKNSVYALAKLRAIESPEEFCLRLSDHFLARNPQVSRVRIEAAETLWTRLSLDGKSHPHTFTRSGNEKRTAALTAKREEKKLQAGIEGLVVLKTTDSAFENFLKDEFTTLKEDRNRILATSIRANWLYREQGPEFDPTWLGVRQTLLEAFAGHESESLQHTLYAMGEAVLKKFPGIREIHLSLPNKHYNLVDLSPFRLENPKEIFLPTDEPHGLIEATLRND